MNSRVPPGKSKSVGFKSFKSFLILITCSQSFLLENSTIVQSLFLLRRWHDSIFSSQISAPICCKTLHTVFSSSLCTIELGMCFIYNTPFGSTVRFSSIDVQGKLPVSRGHRSLLYQLQHLQLRFQTNQV